jgi:hypothetical protein
MKGTILGTVTAADGHGPFLLARFAECMDSADVIVIGGGRPGPRRAGQLRRRGADVLVVGSQTVSARQDLRGWITPMSSRRLQLDLADYAEGGAPVSRFAAFR